MKAPTRLGMGLSFCYISTMIYDQEYVDIQDTMDWMSVQILDSMDYADNMPAFDTPRDLWRWFNLRSVFHHDPKGVELLQTLPTMMDNNIWGIPGAGDCDCFSIGLASALTAQGWPNRIMLVGRRKSWPVHIYNQVFWNGEWVTMDLTNPYYGQERSKYKYYQPINVNL